MRFINPKLIADDLLDAAITTAKINDDAVTLAKMAAGTDGNIITFDASGNPAAVATGSAGNILTSAGAGQPPTFAAAAAGGKLVQAKLASGSGNASTDSSGTSATQIVSTTFTPTSDSNSLIISFTGGGRYAAAENGESAAFITYHPNGGSESSIYSSAPIGDETTASRPKLNICGMVQKTSPGTAEQTVRLRANGRDPVGNTVTVEWTLQLLILEIEA